MALKYLLAGTAQSGAVLLQTLLNREIIRQLLSAEATCISPAGRLLLRCALMTLRKRKRWVDRQQDDDNGCISHRGLSQCCGTETPCRSASSFWCSITLQPEAITIVFDLVKPLRPSRNLCSIGGNAELKRLEYSPVCKSIERPRRVQYTEAVNLLRGLLPSWGQWA